MKALIFDLDDTLVADMDAAKTAILETCQLAYERYGVMPENLCDTLREICRSIWYNSPARPYCVKVGVSSWEGLWARFEGDDENLRILKQWSPTYRFESWRRSLLKHGVDDSSLANELADAFMVNRRKLHMVYDDVRPTLDSLKAHYKLGLLTNGLSDQQREKIAGADVGGYFDAIVISGDLGIGKPDIRIFEKILAMLDVNASDATMIGNSLRSDIQGARNAGMKTIWLNRDGIQHDNSIVPDMEIRSLRELRGRVL